MNLCLNPNPEPRHYRGKPEQADPACSDPSWGQRDHHQHGSPGCSHHHRCKTTAQRCAVSFSSFSLTSWLQLRVLIIASVMSALCSLLYLSVHPTQRKEGGQEGTRKRADLSVVPLDTTGEGHHGGVCERPIPKKLHVLFTCRCQSFFFFFSLFSSSLYVCLVVIIKLEVCVCLGGVKSDNNKVVCFCLLTGCYWW